MSIISSLKNMVAGTLASSADVNSNFEILRVASNSNTTDIANLASCFFRQASTSYDKDDVVYIPNSKFCLLCVTSGTTSDDDIDYTNVSDNINIVDGSVTWRVGYRHKVVGSAITSGSALPLGTIITSCIGLADNYTYQPLNGKTIKYSDNPEFYDYVIASADLNRVGICTEEFYNGELQKYGQCGKFVIDRNNKTLRLPTITRFIGALSSITEIGNTYQDQIKNISAFFWSNVSFNASGAAAQSTTGENGGGNENAKTGGYISFDASRQVNVGDEVYPRHSRYPYYVIVSTSDRRGLDGANGIDGFSPIVELINEDNNCYLKVTDKNGTVSTPNLIAHTPVKGVDYFTPDEINSVAEQSAQKINTEKIFLTQKTVEASENTIIHLDKNTSIYKISPASGMNVSFDCTALDIPQGAVITFEVLLSMSDTVYQVNFLNTTFIEENINYDYPGQHLFVFRSFDSGLSWIGNLQGSW